MSRQEISRGGVKYRKNETWYQYVIYTYIEFIVGFDIYWQIKSKEKKCCKQSEDLVTKRNVWYQQFRRMYKQNRKQTIFKMKETIALPECDEVISNCVQRIRKEKGNIKC